MRRGGQAKSLVKVHRLHNRGKARLPAVPKGLVKQPALAAEGAALDLCLDRLPNMTKQEKKRLSMVLRATEFLFLENIALKLVLEHRAVANWQKLLEHLLADQEILAGVRLKFSDLYKAIEGSTDPDATLETFLGGLPAPKKAH